LVERVWRDGAAHACGSLSPSALVRLTSHVRDNVNRRPAETEVGGVRQRAEVAVVADTALRSSPLGELASEFGALARQHGDPFVSEGFEPNEATVMTYRGPVSGIGPHLDRLRYRELIAIFSVSGRARLELVDDRDGSRVLTGFDCAPGDLVLLRAPGLGGLADGRPLHQVLGPRRGTRSSLSVRMDAHASAEKPAEWA
jgi:hypothetical protein